MVEEADGLGAVLMGVKVAVVGNGIGYGKPARVLQGLLAIVAQIVSLSAEMGMMVKMGEMGQMGRMDAWVV
jgi:hypothetical protein